ncbi:hypothetical protein PRZ48_012986 [Zasmidium cellare]|uniref:Uncharacterized protein n=1 Tax=Zasmidium cellare TaxID=395010 RepID=A0ABR0E3N3_ZASCE|nr:hypothetical protein PRZ48_012986 [Zasmidium cellare]
MSIAQHTTRVTEMEGGKDAWAQEVESLLDATQQRLSLQPTIDPAQDESASSAEHSFTTPLLQEQGQQLRRAAEGKKKDLKWLLGLHSTTPDRPAPTPTKPSKRTLTRSIKLPRWSLQIEVVGRAIHTKNKRTKRRQALWEVEVTIARHQGEEEDRKAMKQMYLGLEIANHRLLDERTGRSSPMILHGWVAKTNT